MEENDFTHYDEAVQEAVDLANRLADNNPEADLWDIADGILAGVVHYWLYTRQPCGDPTCGDCDIISTPEERLKELLRLTEELARGSEYFHSSYDLNVGRA